MVPVIRISLGGWISGYALHQTDLKASLVEVGVREVRMRLENKIVHPYPIRICRVRADGGRTVAAVVG